MSTRCPNNHALRKSQDPKSILLTCAAPEVLVGPALGVLQVRAVRLHETPAADDRGLDDGVEARVQRLSTSYALHLMCAMIIDY